MGEFISEAELHSFLVAINPRYGKYAEALWNHEIRSSAELGNISVTTLVAFGLSNQAHAENVQAFIKQGGTTASWCMPQVFGDLFSQLQHVQSQLAGLPTIAFNVTAENLVIGGR